VLGYFGISCRVVVVRPKGSLEHCHAKQHVPGNEWVFLHSENDVGQKQQTKEKTEHTLYLKITVALRVNSDGAGIISTSLGVSIPSERISASLKGRRLLRRGKRFI
jgi:hypothetical protein